MVVVFYGTILACGLVPAVEGELTQGIGAFFAYHKPALQNTIRHLPYACEHIVFRCCYAVFAVTADTLDKGLGGGVTDYHINISIADKPAKPLIVLLISFSVSAFA